MQNKDFYIGRWITKCLLICFMVASCSRYPARVEEMLALSGSNRAELEKVLEHYVDSAETVSYTHLTLPTTPYV